MSTTSVASLKHEATKPAARGTSEGPQTTDLGSLERVVAVPGLLTPADVPALQRVAGNRAATRLIQAKLAAGSANDSHTEKTTARKAAEIGRAHTSQHLQRMVRRQADEAAGPIALIAEDNAGILQPGQMRKTEFLAQLKEICCAVADEALVGTEYSSVGCPYVAKVFSKLPSYSPARIERIIHTYAPEAATATTAAEYIAPITDRLRVGIVRWLESGEVPALPKDLSTLSDSGSLGQVSVDGTGSQGQAAPNSGSPLFKARAGGAKQAEAPETIRAQLGPGRALDSSVQSRMGSAFGYDFSNVRLHTDSKSSELSNSLNARAFTIGQDVAFGTGEYQPGTLVGDAIIAHELAHVVQQGSARADSMPMQKAGAEYNSLEEDADMSAVSILASLWGGVKGSLANITQQTVPSLRSGLRLQRCVAVAAGGVFLYIVLDPDPANAPGPNTKTFPRKSGTQRTAEALALFAVPGGVELKLGSKVGAVALAGAAGNVSYRAVGDVAQGEFSGVTVYVKDAATGAVVGVVANGAVRLVGKGVTKSLDWLKSLGYSDADIAIIKELSERSAAGPISDEELNKVLQSLEAESGASNWYVQRSNKIEPLHSQSGPVAPAELATPTKPATPSQPPDVAPQGQTPPSTSPTPPKPATQSKPPDVAPQGQTPPSTSQTPPKPATQLQSELDTRIAEAEAELNQARQRTREYQASRAAEGKSRKGGPIKSVWNIKERIALLKRQKTFPDRLILEQPELVGVKAPNGTLKSTSDIAGSGRTPDFVEVRGTKVIAGDLKSAEELKGSFTGGLKKQGAIETEFKDTSKIGMQHDVEAKVLDEAQKSGGIIVIRGRNVLTGEVRTMEVSPSDFSHEVTTYDQVQPN